MALVPHNFKMHMWTSHSPCAARKPDLRVLAHQLAAVHPRLLEVHIDGEQPITVIDDDAVTLIEKWCSKGHNACIRSQHRHSFPGGEIGANVAARLLFVHE